MNWRMGWGALASLLAAPAAAAQPIFYEEALRAAQAEQPLLEAGALRIEGARQTASAADELPDPRLRAGVMNLPVTGPAAFELGEQLPTQIVVGIEQEIPHPATRRARLGLASADIRLAEARLGLVARDVDVAAGMAWIDLFYAQRRLAVAEAALADLQALVPVAISAVASGSARAGQSLAIRREVLAIEDAISAILAEREAAQAMLSRYVPLTEPVAQGAAPPPDVDANELRPYLEGDPRIALAEGLGERAEAAGGLARAARRPDFGVSVSYGRRGSDFGDVVSVMGSVTLPVFAGRRQEPRIAAAEAEAAAARAEAEDQKRAVAAQFAADLAAWRAEFRQWQRAREELLPLAQNRADLETASFAAGRAGLIEVIAAKAALAVLRLDILEREEAAVAAAATLRLTYKGGEP